MGDFVQSLQKPRRVIMLVKAGKPVDATIEGLMQHLEEGDIIIDGGNEWYENSERRMEMVARKGIRYLAMGVSGGEEGARYGPFPPRMHAVSPHVPSARKARCSTTTCMVSSHACTQVLP